MSKGSSDGDVLTNRLSLGLAKHQKLLASWAGMQAEPPPSTSHNDEQEDEDLKQESFGHDRLGVGGILPKDIADGSFTKRAPTSNDKLLEQLIGKKRAKAHIAAQQQAARAGTQQHQKYGKPQGNVKEESDDEDEGRSAAFKSKKRKPNKASKSKVQTEGSHDEDAPRSQGADEIPSDDAEKPKDQGLVKDESENEEEPSMIPKEISSRSKRKPTSFLDEILAERLKKKQNKKSKPSTDV